MGTSIMEMDKKWEEVKAYWNDFRENEMDSDMEYGPNEEQEDKRKNRPL